MKQNRQLGSVGIRNMHNFHCNTFKILEYVDSVRHAVRPVGHVIVATFAPDGPDHCSGLEVMRYNPERLHGEFGAGFDLLDSTNETHHTPFGTEQKFIYCYCRKY